MSCQFRIIDFNYVWQPATELTGSTEDPSFPVSNLKNYSRSYPFRTTASAAQSVVIDIKTAEEIDTFALLHDPIVGSKLTEDAVVTLQGSATDSWASPGYSQVISLTKTTIYTLCFSIPHRNGAIGE